MAEFILGVVILAGAMIDYVTNDNTDDDCF